MEGFENNGTNGRERDEIFSKSVRAGKRTYFFDVKTTKGNDYYLTITESKKRFGEDGKFYYEKHKLFLYKEDFDKFIEGLNESIDKIKTLSPVITEESKVTAGTSANGNNFSDVSFDDLGSK